MRLDEVGARNEVSSQEAVLNSPDESYSGVNQNGSSEHGDLLSDSGYIKVKTMGFANGLDGRERERNQR